MNNKDLQPGQKLWFVPDDTRMRERELIIMGIGRKWIVTDDRHIKLDITTLKNHPESYPHGKAYLTHAHWSAEQHKQREWRKIDSKVREHYYAPTDITLETLYKIQQLLGMEVDRVVFVTPEPERCAVCLAPSTETRAYPPGQTALHARVCLEHAKWLDSERTWQEKFGTDAIDD